jgi:hypothetical protein
LKQSRSIFVVRPNVVGAVVVLGHFYVVVMVVPGRLWETEKQEAVLLVHGRRNVVVVMSVFSVHVAVVVMSVLSLHIVMAVSARTISERRRRHSRH